MATSESNHQPKWLKYFCFSHLFVTFPLNHFFFLLQFYSILHSEPVNKFSVTVYWEGDQAVSSETRRCSNCKQMLYAWPQHMFPQAPACCQHVMLATVHSARWDNGGRSQAFTPLHEHYDVNISQFGQLTFPHCCFEEAAEYCTAHSRSPQKWRPRFPVDAYQFVHDCEWIITYNVRVGAMLRPMMYHTASWLGSWSPVTKTSI